MKSSTHPSFPDRRALVTAALAVLFGTATAIAQTGSASGSSSGSSNTPRSEGSYGSSSTGSTTTSGSATASSPNASPDNTPRAEGAYGTGTTRSTGATDSTTATSTTTDTAGGATTATGRETTSGKLGWMERRFVTKAADSGATEINLAKLATERATHPEVKSFAQKLVEDHKMVSDELKTLASQKNVKLDEEDLGSDRAYKRLSKKSGHEFDQEFVEHMVDMHEADVKMFEKCSTDAKDSALRSFAAKHVDHLRQHLQTAQSLRSTIMPTGRTDDSSATSTTGSSATTIDSTSGTSGTSGTTGTSGASSTDATGTGTSSSGTSTDTTRRDGSR